MQLKKLVQTGVIENVEDVEIFTIDMTRTSVETNLQREIKKIYSDDGTTCIIIDKTGEEELKEQKDNLLLNNAKQILQHCNSHDCLDCIFYTKPMTAIDDYCLVNTPINWRLQGQGEEN